MFGAINVSSKKQISNHKKDSKYKLQIPRGEVVYYFEFDFYLELEI